VFIIFAVLLVLFIVLSVLAFMGKLTAFITGSKTKDNTETIYNERGAGNFIGLIMSMLVVATAVGMLGFLIPSARWLIIAAPLFFTMVLIFAIIYINTRDRFVDDNDDAKNEDELHR